MASRLLTGLLDVLADAGVMTTAPTVPAARVPVRTRAAVRLCIKVRLPAVT